MSGVAYPDGHRTDIINEGAETERRWWCHFPTRYTVLLLNFFAVSLSVIFNATLNVAMVKMVNSSSSDNSTDEIHTTNQSKVFNWSKELQGTILNAFLVAYGFGSLAGGRLAEIFGIKRVFGTGISVMTILTLLTPLASSISAYFLIAVRFVEGLMAGMTQPIINVVVSRWIPITGRSRGVAFLNGAGPVGNVVGNLLSGVLCKSSFLDGWPLPFYVFGSLGLLWSIAYYFLMYNSPSEHPRISVKEKEYILANQGNETATKAVKIPLKAILMTVPVWAAVFANISEAWVISTLQVKLPMYWAQVLHFDVDMAGLLAAIPPLCECGFMGFGGYLADLLIKKNIFQKTVVRKIMNSIGQLSSATCLILIPFVGYNRILIVTLVTFSFGLNGFISSGYKSAIVDMAPSYSGSIYGFSIFTGYLVSFASPYIISAVTMNTDTLHQWDVVFWIDAGFYTTGAIGFLLGGSAELQSWGRQETEESDQRPSDE